MKKIIFVLIILIIPSVSFATSGACSSHGGVNCSAGANYAGKVQCNDGWVNSSVYFSDTEECKTNSGCGEYEKPEYDMLTKMWSDFINKACLLYTSDAADE